MTNSALKSGRSFVNKNVLVILGDRQFPVLPALRAAPKGKPPRLTDDFFDVMTSLRAIWVTQANLRNQAITLKPPAGRSTPVMPLPAVRGLTTFAENPPMDFLAIMYA